ncbi:DUF4145 domain-containing protein [Nocardia arizonensis]|uniref:DUF4145 domain-containing protein n=1 Tax=Nocardia arizonensis TaxID=1141647 RepID=UPI001EF50A8D|nr:DUF4145 domain-containing protein [Nocardia arizonensis]
MQNSVWSIPEPGGKSLQIGAFACSACRWGSLGVMPMMGVSPSHERFERANAADIVWHPANAFGQDFPDVPAHIASPATEATECLSIGHNRAAVILARAVVEAVAKDKGIANGNLASKIDSLHSRGLIRAHTKDAAHEIRFVGNEIAHGDFAQQSIDGDEAADVLNFMIEVLEEIYQGPARVDRQRVARQAKTGQANTP